MSAQAPKSKRLTVPQFAALKREGRKSCVLTAYDYTMAQLLDSAGVDAILVGDSMSMVVQGHENTLPVTLDEMIYHAEMVGRAVQRAIDQLVVNKTVIVIAHRLSTIIAADQILVLENGQVIERGNHAELLAGHGRYADLWKAQQRSRHWRVIA